MITRLVRWCFVHGMIGVAMAHEADMVLRWNEVVHTTIRVDQTSPGPTWGSRNPAMVHLAIYEAVNSISRTYQPFYEYLPAAPGASAEAAVAQAAHDVLVSLYPAQRAVLGVNLASSLRRLPAAGLAAGTNVGRAAAELVISRRSQDGSSDTTPYPVKDTPGKWRPDPLHPLQTALGANWGKVTPFALENSAQFRVPIPPALDSQEYAKSYDEVRRLGARIGSERTDEQTEIGIFWGYDRGGLGPPPILYDQIARLISLEQDFTLEENARLFAMLEVAQADSGIACWESKYYYEFWRPIGGLRAGETDGNSSTLGVPDWEPLGAPGGGPPRDFTPPFPAYPSGHATFGGAIFRILELVFGTDSMPFTVVSEEVPAAPRTFSSFSQASIENGRSRIYLGVHWDFDDIQGRALGRKIADQVFRSKFLPVLRAQRKASEFNLLWPANAKRYRASYAINLGLDSWTPMSEMSSVIEGDQVLKIPMNHRGFFRLEANIP